LLFLTGDFFFGSGDGDGDVWALLAYSFLEAALLPFEPFLLDADFEAFLDFTDDLGLLASSLVSFLDSFFCTLSF
jgi:hypothetical protein